MDRQPYVSSIVPAKSGLSPPVVPEKPAPGFLTIYGAKSNDLGGRQLAGGSEFLTIFRPSAASVGAEEKASQDQRASTSAVVPQAKYRKMDPHFGYGFDGKYRSSVSRDQIRKKEDRREKNRLAAKNCREEKQNYIKSLEARVAMLEARNRELIGKLSELKEIILQLSKNQCSDSAVHQAALNCIDEQSVEMAVEEAERPVESSNDEEISRDDSGSGPESGNDGSMSNA